MRQLVAGVFESSTLPQATHPHHRTVSAVRGLLRREHEREPDVAATEQCELKRLRQDADDGVVLPVETNGAADRAGLLTETIAPQHVADHRQMRLPGVSPDLIEQSSEPRVDAQHSEESRSHHGAANALGSIPPGQAEVGLPVAGDLLERLRAALPVEEVRRIHRTDVA